jgi:SNF2 family DNA or RNA helicase
MMPRVNLLIADDVGLGKTIESGLVLQEMISRNRVRDCLIVCPASLQVQWQEEMDEKFNLSFKIIDRHVILNLRREYGTHVNPWQSHPWLITSMDFIKREVHLRNFVAGLRKSDGTMSSWDLMILDEAHNCAPVGRQWYVRDSQRTKMLRNLSPHFRHRLFVTATPHNGYTESFTGSISGRVEP